MKKAVICLLVVHLMFVMGCSHPASLDQRSEQPLSTDAIKSEEPASIDPELIISNSEMESVLGYAIEKSMKTTVAQYTSVENAQKFVQIQISLVPVSRRPFSPVDYYQKFVGFKEVEIGDEACYLLINKLEIQRGNYTISIQLFKDAPESLGISLGRVLCEKLDQYLSD